MSLAVPSCRRSLVDSLDMVEGEEILGELEIDTVRFGAITSVAAHGDLVAVSVTDRGTRPHRARC